MFFGGGVLGLDAVPLSGWIWLLVDDFFFKIEFQRCVCVGGVISNFAHF